MDNMWEKIKKGFKDGAALSMEKIEEYTKIGKLKVEELGAKRKVERNFMDMGERVFDLFESGKTVDIASDLTVKKSIDNVKALKAELEEIERKIADISESYKKDKNEPADEVSGI